MSPTRAVDDSTAVFLADTTWLAAEYTTGSAPQIAEELGCTPSQVFGALRRAGIARRREEYVRLVRRWQTWPTDVQEQAVDSCRAGQPAPAVAEELRVSVKGMYELLRERELVRSKSDARQLAPARAKE